MKVLCCAKLDETKRLCRHVDKLSTANGTIMIVFDLKFLKFHAAKCIQGFRIDFFNAEQFFSPSGKCIEPLTTPLKKFQVITLILVNDC